MTDFLALDDIDGQARAGWQLGEQLCTRCNGYHQTWGLLRAAKVMRAGETDRRLLMPILADMVRPGTNILIAGAADAGLLQLVAESAPARPIDITLLDRCPSPIALIHHIALPPGISVDAREADLTELDEPGRYDVVLSHSMLPFVDPATRIAILQRLRASLSPEGKLLLVVRTAPVYGSEIPDAHDQAWLDRTYAKLSHVPDLVRFCGPDLPSKLQQYAHSRRARSYGFRNEHEVATLLEDSGFRIERQLLSEVSSELEVAGRTIAKQSHIFIARSI